MSDRMAGKVALVTGAAQGIGRAVAERYASEGAVVGVLDLKLDRAQAAAEAIVAAGGRAQAFGGNVAERQTLAAAIDALEAAHGRFDVLVSNAAWVRYNPIDAITPEILERMMGTGFHSVVWGIQCAAPAMARSGGGSIVNIASAAGFLGIPNAMIYCGIKSGLLGLTRSAAAELGPKGIRVNAICPGSVQTEGVRINVDPAMVAKRLSRTPRGRLGEVSDIASAALFLGSDESDWITGESLLVDGGTTHAFL